MSTGPHCACCKPAQGPYLEGRTLLVRVPEIRGALSQAVLSTSPLDESRTHTPYWNPVLSRARLPVPPQGGWRLLNTLLARS